MRVVVTGGAGFIGANLCSHLGAAAEVDVVVALDDLSTGSRANLDGGPAALVEGSILDRARHRMRGRSQTAASAAVIATAT